MCHPEYCAQRDKGADMTLTAYRDIFQQADAFRRLDAFLNSEATRSAAQQFHSDLVGVVDGTADPNFGPFDSDDEMRQHWVNDWIDDAGHGGNFWRYLSGVNIYELVTRALTTSIGRARSTDKRHLTVWLPIHDAPNAGEDLSLADQERLFSFGVHESDDEVQLVIVTPRPIEGA
jgi:hypothetical protein